MNYIGSKYSLWPAIAAILDRNRVPRRGTAVDLFAGTTTVAQMLKHRGHNVVCNDWQMYSYFTGVALVELDALPRFARLPAAIRECSVRAADVATHSALRDCVVDEHHPALCTLRALAALPGCDGRFVDEYCEGGVRRRLYFSRENGRRIQQIRDTIEGWQRRGWIDRREHAWLVACLLESADRVANTASVYGAYLKRIKPAAARPLRLTALIPIPRRARTAMSRATCVDASTLFAREFCDTADLTYIDPPYNARQYSTNYHVLETLARWDLGQFTPRGVTGLRPADQQVSPFCSRRHASRSFRDLLYSLRSRWVLFSYNNEGLLGEDDLRTLFATICEYVDFQKVRHSRFRADQNHARRQYRADRTQEFLILGRLRNRR